MDQNLSITQRESKLLSFLQESQKHGQTLKKNVQFLQECLDQEKKKNQDYKQLSKRMQQEIEKDQQKMESQETEIKQLKIQVRKLQIQLNQQPSSNDEMFQTFERSQHNLFKDNTQKKLISQKSLNSNYYDSNPTYKKQSFRDFNQPQIINQPTFDPVPPVGKPGNFNRNNFTQNQNSNTNHSNKNQIKQNKEDPFETQSMNLDERGNNSSLYYRGGINLEDYDDAMTVSQMQSNLLQDMRNSDIFAFSMLKQNKIDPKPEPVKKLNSLPEQKIDPVPQNPMKANANTPSNLSNSQSIKRKIFDDNNGHMNATVQTSSSVEKNLSFSFNHRQSMNSKIQKGEPQKSSPGDEDQYYQLDNSDEKGDFGQILPTMVTSQIKKIPVDAPRFAVFNNSTSNSNPIKNTSLPQTKRPQTIYYQQPEILSKDNIYKQEERTMIDSGYSSVSHLTDSRREELFSKKKPNFHMNGAKVIAEDIPVYQDEFDDIPNESSIKNQSIITRDKQTNPSPAQIVEITEGQSPTQKLFSLFEEFFIITADQSQLYQFNEYSSKAKFYSSSLDPIVIYNYPDSTSNMNCDKRRIVPQFAFPFGVEVEKSRKTKSLSQLNQIIFGENVSDQYKNVFVFTIKSDDSFLKKSQKSEEHINLLSTCNPNHLLYCICVTTRDFFQDTDPTKQYFYSVNKTFCIMTYFPFINFFIEIIQDIIINQIEKIKVSQIASYTQYQEEDDISQIDIDFYQVGIKKTYFVKTALDDITQTLEKIHQPSIYNFETDLKFPGTTQDLIYLTIPDRSKCSNIECEWGLCLVMSLISPQKLSLIIFSLLLEQSIVFISENRALLTASILLFQAVLKPFKWPHPLVFTLSQDLMGLFDSPVPIIVGLNQSYKYVTDQKMVQQYENCLFVDVEDYKLSQQEQAFQKSSIFCKFEQMLQSNFLEMQQIVKNPTTVARDSVFHQENDEEFELCNKIIKNIREFFFSNIITLLPNHPILKKEQRVKQIKYNNQSVINQKYETLDIDRIKEQIWKEHKINDDFLEKFFKTQEYYGV